MGCFIFTKYFTGYGLLKTNDSKEVSFSLDIDKDEFIRYCHHYNLSINSDKSYLRYVEWKFSLLKMKEDVLLNELKDIKALQLETVS